MQNFGVLKKVRRKKPNLSQDKVKKILEEPDWINAKRYNNNLKEMIGRFPEGCPDRVAASVLGLSVEEYQSMYETALKKLRTIMDIDTNEK